MSFTSNILIKKTQKPTNKKGNPSMKINMDGIKDTASGDTIRDSKSPVTKKIKITESGDSNNTLYLTCTDFNVNEIVDDTFANPTPESTLLETAIADSSLECTIGETTLDGTVTNSSLDETLAEPTLEGTLVELSLNSTFGQRPCEESPEKIINQIEEPSDKTIKDLDIKSEIDFDVSAYFSFDSSLSDVPQSIEDFSVANKKAELSDNAKEIWKLFNEYREQGFISSDTSTSFLKEESQLDQSWLYDPVINTEDHNDLKEIEIMLSNLKVTNRKVIMGVRDEKDRSFEHVHKISANVGDEFGTDVETTNLLLLARQSLEIYAEIEEIYAKREKRARSIVRRRFHITLEEFFDTIDEGIEIKEGLDRYENFLESVNKSAMDREKRDKIQKNIVKFNTFASLKNLQRPFRSQREKHAYFMSTRFIALYLNAAKVNKELSQKRGYASV